MTEANEDPERRLSAWFEHLLAGWLEPDQWQEPNRAIFVELLSQLEDPELGMIDYILEPAEWLPVWRAELIGCSVQGNGDPAEREGWYHPLTTAPPTVIAELSGSPATEGPWNDWIQAWRASDVATGEGAAGNFFRETGSGPLFGAVERLRAPAAGRDEIGLPCFLCVADPEPRIARRWLDSLNSTETYAQFKSEFDEVSRS